MDGRGREDQNPDESIHDGSRHAQYGRIAADCGAVEAQLENQSMRSLRTLVCVGAVLIGVGGRAQAQDPDVRDIPPLVMLVVDSSGSMEDLPACQCASATDCSECVPDCSLSNTFMEPPKKTLK